MNRFELWFLRRLIAREVVQSEHHFLKTTRLYRLIAEAWINEFTEDNTPTIEAHLKECFNTANEWLRETP